MYERVWSAFPWSTRWDEDGDEDVVWWWWSDAVLAFDDERLV